MVYSDTLKGKRLLILGGAIQCLKVVDAAKELGVYTIITDVFAQPEVIEAADESLTYSVLDVEGLYQWCLKNPVDGILNFCVDPSQRTHQILCERFGFPCYGTKEQYRIMTDKAAFKQLCIENGVDVIPEYSETHLEDVEYPVLVKPASSSGSRGTKVCYNQEDLRLGLTAAKDISKNGQALIEKYLYGHPDFSMSYLIIDGEPYLTRTLDRYVGCPEDNLQRQCICARCPSVFTDLYLEKAHENVKRMLRNLGLQNATVFMQGFIDGDKFRFYDPGLRFSGAEYERMLKSATGIDVVKAFVAYALGEPLTPLADQLKNDVFLLGGKCGLQLFIVAYPGKICSVSGVEEVSAIPEVIKVVQKHVVGYEVPDTGDVTRRIFEIVTLSENNKEAICAVIDSIRDRLSIRDMDGHEMLTPMIEINRMYG